MSRGVLYTFKPHAKRRPDLGQAIVDHTKLVLGRDRRPRHAALSGMTWWSQLLYKLTYYKFEWVSKKVSNEETRYLSPSRFHCRNASVTVHSTGTLRGMYLLLLIIFLFHSDAWSTYPSVKRKCIRYTKVYADENTWLS